MDLLWDAVRDALGLIARADPELLRIAGLSLAVSWVATGLAACIGIPSSRFVDVAADADLFTSSLPYALEHAWRHTRVSSGDVGLIVSVGSGLQVGCATYRF